MKKYILPAVGISLTALYAAYTLGASSTQASITSTATYVHSSPSYTYTPPPSYTAPCPLGMLPGGDGWCYRY